MTIRPLMRWLVPAGALLAMSCGTAPTGPTSNMVPGGNAKPDPVDAEAWNCQGNLVPPNGWEQETAFESKSTPNAKDVAVSRSRARLLKRLCGNGANCDALAAGIATWKTGAGNGQVCSMAVIDAKDLEAWRRANTSVAGLDKAMARAAKELLGDKPKMRVAIDKIIDNGAAGGDRADWLSQRMQRALSQAGASVKDVPKSWNGQGLPPGIDMVVGAVSTSRKERQNRVVEVSWNARVRGSSGLEKRFAAPLTFPEEAAPSGGEVVVTLPPSDPDLSVRLETQHGGSLCLGERTQLWLYSAQTAHVRVFDLYGKDGALLLFPNEDNPSGIIKAGQSIPLGGDLGFEAVPAPGSDVERFLVIAAPKPQGLGQFAKSSGYCRVPTGDAVKLHQNKDMPAGAKAASDSFRLIKHADCPAPPAPGQRQGQAEALEGLPLCKLK